MGHYTNIKCGNCGHSFTGGYVQTNGLLPTFLGVPYYRCPQCGTVNDTGDRPWSTFHLVGKIYHWTSIVLRSIIFGIMKSLLLILVLHFGLDILVLDDTDASFIILSAGIILSMVIWVFVELKYIEKVERTYLEQTKSSGD